MLYKISNKQEKSWNDKKYVEAELVNPQGELFKVSAWNGEYDGKNEIECELEKNDKGYWKIVTPKKVAGVNFKAMQVEKTMERKEQSISKFQDSKEYSIKVASTFSNAVNLAIANFKQNPTSLRTLEEEVEYWREWCWTHYDVNPEQYPPF